MGQRRAADAGRTQAMTKGSKRTPHSLRHSRSRGPRPDVAPEVTGTDASMDEAELGSEGNGALLFGADFTEGFPDPLEQEPDAPDLQPDHVFVGDRREAETWAAEEAEITARPTEKADFSEAEDPLDEIEQ